MLWLKKTVAGSVMLTLMIGLAACGSSSSSSSSSAGGGQASRSSQASSGAQTIAASGGKSCGSIPTRMPGGSELAKLPASARAGYNLFPGQVTASAWAHWKPKTRPPYTVAYSTSQLTNPFTVQLMGALNKLQQDSHGLVKPIIYQSANNSAQTQIAQLQQDIRNKVTLLMVWEQSPAADGAVLEAAGRAGIPSITYTNVPTNPYMIGFDANNQLTGATMAQGLVKLMGGKGSLLEAQGIAGIPATDGPLQGAGEVLANCPSIKIVGKLSTEYSPATAKTVTLEFLAAHPQPIDGVFEDGQGSIGVVPAFLQDGRTVPPLATFGAEPGVLAYWNQHKSTFRSVAVSVPTTGFADAGWSITTGLLQGRGIKVNDIEQTPNTVTSTNLSQYVEPGWSLNTALGAAPGPPGMFFPSTYLNQFFTNPAK